MSGNLMNLMDEIEKEESPTELSKPPETKTEEKKKPEPKKKGEGRMLNEVPTKGTKDKAFTIEVGDIDGVDIKADKNYGDKVSAKTGAMYDSTLAQLNNEQEMANQELQKDTTNDFIQSLLNIGEEKAQELQNKAKEKPKMNQRFDASKDSNLGRYNYRIQHGWHIPAMDRDWIEYAQLENQARPSIQQAQANKDARAQAMSDRVAEMARKRDLDAWKTENKRIVEGGFNDLAGRQFNQKRAEDSLTSIIYDYVKNGGNVIDGRVVGLPDYGGNHAGYKAVSKEAGQYSTDAMEMDTYLNELKQDLANKTYGTGAMKGKYDAEINKIQRILSGAGQNQADADKIRVQYLYLPEEMQDAFQKQFALYMKRLGDIAYKTGGDKAFANVNSRANRLMAGAKEYLMSENPQEKIEGGLQFINAISNLEGGFVDSPTAMVAVKEAWKAFEENLVKIAVIDPRVMYTQMALAKKLSVNKYNNLIRERGGIPMAKSNTIGENGMQYQNFKVPTIATPVDTRLASRDPLPKVGSNYNNKGTGTYTKE